MKHIFSYIFLILLSAILMQSFYAVYLKNKEVSKEQLIQEIKSHYSNKAVTNDKVKLYIKDDQEYIHSGYAAKGIKFNLEEISNIDENNKYFKIENLPYYVYYKDLLIDNNIEDTKKYYKNYLSFNENIVTNDTPTLYDENNNFAFQLNEKLSLPIIIKDLDKYYVEYNDSLLYINKDDVMGIKPTNNTDEIAATAIASINYHFFYDKSIGQSCNSVICMEISKFEEQMKYLSDNNYYAVTMRDLELFIDNKIRLPKKSLNINIDDGGKYVVNALPIIEKYKMNTTVFLISAWYDKKDYESEYVEVHSHGYNIHNPGYCKGGYGSALKCLDREILLNDLAKSRELLNNTTVFCYPYYEHNNYAIEIVKEAGFKMAFINGSVKIKPGTNKLLLPRYPIHHDLTIDKLKRIIN